MNNLVSFIAILIVVSVIINLSKDYDDTDDVINEKRSGFVLYTDHLTGCQYLRTGIFGNTFPRLDGTKRHIGCINQGVY